MDKAKVIELIGQAIDAQDDGNHDRADALVAQVLYDRFPHWDGSSFSDVLDRAVRDNPHAWPWLMEQAAAV